MSIDKYLDNKLCVSTDIETTDKYWDCECEHNYIHPKSQKHCDICGMDEEDSPDSRVDEVLKAGFSL